MPALDYFFRMKNSVFSSFCKTIMGDLDDPRCSRS